MFKSHLAWLVCLACCVVCAACQVDSVTPPAAPTRVVVHLLDLSRVTLPPPPTPQPPTAAPPIPTAIPSLPTPTPPATQLPPEPATFNPPAPQQPASPTASAPVSTPACREQAVFVRHLSISPNTALSPLQNFGKVWRITNTGTCTWTTAYSLVFLAGQSMAKMQVAAPAGVPFPYEVPPGSTLDLAVQLVAPRQPGEYAGYWVIQAPNGEKFGLGLEGVDPLVVQIVVRDPNKVMRDQNGTGSNLPCG